MPVEELKYCPAAFVPSFTSTVCVGGVVSGIRLKTCAAQRALPLRTLPVPTVTGPNAVGSSASASSSAGAAAMLSMRSVVATPLIAGLVAVRVLLLATDQIEMRFVPVVETLGTFAVRFWAPALSLPKLPSIGAEDRIPE